MAEIITDPLMDQLDEIRPGHAGEVLEALRIVVRMTGGPVARPHLVSTADLRRVIARELNVQL